MGDNGIISYPGVAPDAGRLAKDPFRYSGVGEDLRVLIDSVERTSRRSQHTGEDWFVAPGRRRLSTRHYMEVRYEALVSDPERVLKGICDFIRLDFRPLMLRYWERSPQRLKEHGLRCSPDGTLVVTHERRLEQQRLTMQPPRKDRILAWRTEMCAAEQSEFYRVAGRHASRVGIR